MTPMLIHIDPTVVLGCLAVMFLIGAILYRRRREQKNRDLIITNMWANYIRGNEVHTVPEHDLVDHEWVDCACSPQTVPVETPDGGMNWQVIHNALDGRK
jgi:hypothetical protein